MVIETLIGMTFPPRFSLQVRLFVLPEIFPCQHSQVECGFWLPDMQDSLKISEEKICPDVAQEE
ncbi:MAG: hypothetical protein KBA49_07300, partial [Methanolinea sp.]|nr:hypothetical protein [Methanolinea sp.]